MGKFDFKKPSTYHLNDSREKIKLFCFTAKGEKIIAGKKKRYR